MPHRLFICLLLIVLTGCAASSENVAAPATRLAPADASTPIAADATAPPVAVIDYSCRADADCAVQNVGNCCGYSPACVNRDSATFPEQVRARCAREGTMAICGFREIAACTCNHGRCEAAPDDVVEPATE